MDTNTPTLNIPGVIGEVPDTPEVRKALKEYEESQNEGVAQAVDQPPLSGLEKYGVTLRPFGLRQSARMHRLMGAVGKIPESHQLHIMIFTLGAPLLEVYEALDLVEKEGLPKFMVRIDEWFDKAGIPDDLTAKTMELLTKSFQLAEKLMPAPTPEINDPGDLKKNLSLSSPPPLTSSPASTAGAEK